MTENNALLQHLRVLYAEDNKLLRLEVRSVLSKHLGAFDMAANGREAWELFQKGPYDVVMIDIVMPEMDGMQLAEKIKERHPEQRIIVTSSTEDAQHIIELINIGVSRFITKPINYKSMMSYLEDVARSIDNERRILEYQKTIEDKNRELEKTLHDVREMQYKLIESKKMASLGSLAAGVAHEINTPVGITVTAVSTLIEKTSLFNSKFAENALKKIDMTTFLADVTQALNLIDSSMKKVTKLVRSFKAFSIHEYGEQTRRKCGLQQVIQYALFIYSNRYGLENLPIEICCDPDLEIISSPEILQSVLEQLIDNAFEHGIQDKPDGKITIRCHSDNEFVELAVQDNGKGIAQQDLQKIFEPFYTTQRLKGFSGLGLSTVYNLVDHKLKGTITVTSQENAGSEFKIRLPVMIPENWAV